MTLLTMDCSLRAGNLHSIGLRRAQSNDNSQLVYRRLRNMLKKRARLDQIERHKIAETRAWRKRRSA
jgi:hypothetical protein